MKNILLVLVVYMPFKKGAVATIHVPLKIRSSSEIPANVNEDVLNYMVSGESSYSKQSSTIHGRFITP
jgi:hypothetical protein